MPVFIAAAEELNTIILFYFRCFSYQLFTLLYSHKLLEITHQIDNILKYRRKVDARFTHTYGGWGTFQPPTIVTNYLIFAYL